jgi:uncharacterized protein (DUF934 family)
MPMLIRWLDGAAVAARDTFVALADDAPLNDGDVILSWSRFQTQSEELIALGRKVGVRLASAEGPEVLAPWLDRISLIALEFPKFRDGRAYSSARLLRERMGWRGELRAVGDVLVEQAYQMIRCGFDAFEPGDGSAPADWAAAAARFVHVYQRAADSRPPAFVEREGAQHGL